MKNTITSTELNKKLIYEKNLAYVTIYNKIFRPKTQDNFNIIEDGFADASLWRNVALKLFNSCHIEEHINKVFSEVESTTSIYRKLLHPGFRFLNSIRITNHTKDNYKKKYYIIHFTFAHKHEYEYQTRVDMQNNGEFSVSTSKVKYILKKKENGKSLSLSAAQKKEAERKVKIEAKKLNINITNMKTTTEPKRNLKLLVEKGSEACANSFKSLKDKLGVFEFRKGRKNSAELFKQAKEKYQKVNKNKKHSEFDALGTIGDITDFQKEVFKDKTSKSSKERVFKDNGISLNPKEEVRNNINFIEDFQKYQIGNSDYEVSIR